MINLKNFNNFILNENFKTYPIQDVLKFLKQKGLNQHRDFYTAGTDKVFLCLRPKHKKKYKEIINRLEIFYGWYLATVTNYKDYGKDKNVSYYKNNIEEFITNNEGIDKYETIGNLCFEPKYDIIIDYNDIPDKIYHITNGRYYKKIMKKGLIPKHLDRISYHPDRIFFAKTEEMCIELSEHSEFILTNPIILTIDAKGLKEKGIKFHEDSNLHDDGIYVINNISPKYIIHMKKL